MAKDNVHKPHYYNNNRNNFHYVKHKTYVRPWNCF